MMHTHQKSSDPVATIGLDIGKNTFHLVGLDKRGAIVESGGSGSLNRIPASLSGTPAGVRGSAGQLAS
jgi:hypothetical protein